MDNLSFRVANSNDTYALCQLFAKVFAIPMTPAHWTWKYTTDALQDSINIVGVDTAGNIVTHMGAQVHHAVNTVTYVPVWIHGCDMMIHPDYRGNPTASGVFAQTVNALQQTIDQRFPKAFCYGFPGVRPYRLGQRIGCYQEMHRINLAVLTIPEHLRAKILAPKLTPVRTVELAAIMQTDPHRYGINNTEDYLNWRYEKHPARSYQAFVWRIGWRRYAGLVVEKQPGSWTVVEISGIATLTSRLIYALAACARHAGCHQLRWDNHWTQTPEPLAALQDTGIVAVWIKTPQGICEKEKLYLTPAATDVF